MNLKRLTDQVLIQNTDRCVREEREVLTRTLHHFREIERRRLYCDFQYGSLRQMLVQHYGYSDDEAYRRISAMQLITELPEVEEKINQGELSLSHLGIAQSFFRQEKKVQQAEVSKELKLEILEQISDKTIRETQKFMFSQSSAPETLRPEKVSIVSQDRIEFRFTAKANMENKVQELKGLLAHKYPNLSNAELFELLCDQAIERIKSHKSADKPQRPSATHMKPRSSEAVPPLSQNQAHGNIQSVSHLQVRRQVWRQDECKCSNCSSAYALEIDHRLPRAKGGTDDKENLRLLCRKCNQRAAIRQLGIEKMSPLLR